MAEILLFSSVAVILVGVGVIVVTQKAIRQFDRVSNVMIDAVVRAVDKGYEGDPRIFLSKLVWIATWKKKLDAMHRRAQEAEAEANGLRKAMVIRNSFWQALDAVSSADDRCAVQKNCRLVMKKADGVVRISSSVSGLVSSYIHPSWLREQWEIKDVRDQA